MTYPKDVQKFLLWTKAMVAGATVGQPNYGKKLATRPPSSGGRRRRRRKRKRKTQDN